MIHVEAVNLTGLSAHDLDAILQAETEIIASDAKMDSWDSESARLTELFKVCGLIVGNRIAAELSVTSYFDKHETLFTDEEKKTLLNVALESCKRETSNDDIRVLNILSWTRKVSRAYRSMQSETLDNVVGLPSNLINKIK